MKYLFFKYFLRLMMFWYPYRSDLSMWRKIWILKTFCVESIYFLTCTTWEADTKYQTPNSLMLQDTYLVDRLIELKTLTNNGLVSYHVQVLSIIFSSLFELFTATILPNTWVCLLTNIYIFTKYIFPGTWAASFCPLGVRKQISEMCGK